MAGSRELATRIPCCLHAFDAELASARFPRGAVDSDAIHGNAVEGRLVALGVDVFAQHRAHALWEGQRLHG